VPPISMSPEAACRESPKNVSTPTCRSASTYGAAYPLSTAAVRIRFMEGAPAVNFLLAPQDVAVILLVNTSNLLLCAQ